MKEKIVALKKKAMEYGCEIAILDFYVEFSMMKDCMKKHKRIIQWIHENLGRRISEPKMQMKESEMIADDAPIWIYWKQGFSDAPEVVKQCLISVKKHSGKHPVIELSDDNLCDYVVLPDYIMEKIGVVTYAQLSDIIRLTLLSRYGGIWMDATILMQREFDAEMYQHKLYSNKLAYRKEDSMYVSGNRWSAFFLACGKNNQTITLCKELFYAYHKFYGKQALLDYFLIDYMIYYLYENRWDIKEQIDEIPENNEFIYWFQKNWKDTFDEKTWNTIVGTTCIFKLDYRKVTGSKHHDDYYNKVICRQEKGE